MSRLKVLASAVSSKTLIVVTDDYCLVDGKSVELMARSIMILRSINEKIPEEYKETYRKAIALYDADKETMKEKIIERMSDFLDEYKKKSSATPPVADEADGSDGSGSVVK